VCVARVAVLAGSESVVLLVLRRTFPVVVVVAVAKVYTWCECCVRVHLCLYVFVFVCVCVCAQCAACVCVKKMWCVLLRWLPEVKAILDSSMKMALSCHALL